MKPTPAPARPSRLPPAGSRGFTLLEVLIAIVIFSIGLFGIAGLQANGMRFTQGSQLRLVAIEQAEAIADRMRANPAGLVEGHYNLEGETLDGSIPAEFDVDCRVDTCDREQLAVFDLVTWNGPNGEDDTLESNADLLPGGSGAVCIDSTPDDGDVADWACDNDGGIYVIKVQWTERTAAGDDVVINEDEEGEAADTAVKRIFVRVTPYADMAVDGIESGEEGEGEDELGGGGEEPVEDGGEP